MKFVCGGVRGKHDIGSHTPETLSVPEHLIWDMMVPPENGQIYINRHGAVLMSRNTFEQLRGEK